MQMASGKLDWNKFVVRDLDESETTYRWNAMTKTYARDDALMLDTPVCMFNINDV